jgi:hypothetical protein
MQNLTPWHDLAMSMDDFSGNKLWWSGSSRQHSYDTAN